MAGSMAVVQLARACPSRFHYQQPGRDQYQRGWGGPLKMVSSIAPIPAKLAKKIRALEFVEMRELLPDNIAMAERLAALPSSVTHAKPPSEQDIGGDLSHGWPTQNGW